MAYTKVGEKLKRYLCRDLRYHYDPRDVKAGPTVLRISTMISTNPNVGMLSEPHKKFALHQAQTPLKDKLAILRIPKAIQI